MSLHKHYLQSETNALETLENKFDFIPDISNHAAAKSLNRLCYHQTLEIAQLKELKQPSEKQEKNLAEYRDYALLHQQKRSGD